ncbi:hypothetical protein DAI43_29735, partial [Achromobacter xylosoxidans]
GLMGGLGFAATYDPVKWSDAVTAIATVFAAVGTVGTLVYQVLQTAKTQRQLMVQEMLQEQTEAELLQRWLAELLHSARHLSTRMQGNQKFSETEVAVWKDELASMRAKVAQGKGRISSRLGHKFYEGFEELLNWIDWMTSQAPDWRTDRHGSFGKQDVEDLATVLKHRIERVAEWQRDLEARSSH